VLVTWTPSRRSRRAAAGRAPARLSEGLGKRQTPPGPESDSSVIRMEPGPEGVASAPGRRGCQPTTHWQAEYYVTSLSSTVTVMVRVPVTLRTQTQFKLAPAPTGAVRASVRDSDTR
jgi:hypothetical protein